MKFRLHARLAFLHQRKTKPRTISERKNPWPRSYAPFSCSAEQPSEQRRSIRSQRTKPPSWAYRTSPPAFSPPPSTTEARSNMMTGEVALIREQGQTFAVLAVKPPVVQNPRERE